MDGLTETALAGLLSKTSNPDTCRVITQAIKSLGILRTSRTSMQAEIELLRKEIDRLKADVSVTKKWHELSCAENERLKKDNEQLTMRMKAAEYGEDQLKDDLANQDQDVAKLKEEIKGLYNLLAAAFRKMAG